MSESNYVMDPSDERALREQLDNAEYDCQMYLSEIADLRRKVEIAETSVEAAIDYMSLYPTPSMELIKDNLIKALDAMKGGA